MSNGFNSFISTRAMGGLAYCEFPTVGQPRTRVRGTSNKGSAAKQLSGSRGHDGTGTGRGIDARGLGGNLAVLASDHSLPARNEMCGCGRTRLSRYNRSIDCFLCQEEREVEAAHR